MVISLSAHCALCCKDFPRHTMRLSPALLQWQWPAVAVNPAFLGSCGVCGVEISGNHLVPGTCINMETPAAKTGCEDSLVQSIKPVQIQKNEHFPLLNSWLGFDPLLHPKLKPEILVTGLGLTIVVMKIGTHCWFEIHYDFASRDRLC